MYFEGSVTISAPIDKVWNSMTDAEFVAQCAPGVKEIEVILPNEKYVAVASISFGAVVAVFKADVEYLELREHEFARIKAHGVTPGSAVDVVSEMSFIACPDSSTELKWSANIEIAGKIVSFASRMMGSLAKKLTTTFFDCVKRKIEA